MCEQFAQTSLPFTHTVNEQLPQTNKVSSIRFVNTVNKNGFLLTCNQDWRAVPLLMAVTLIANV